MLNRRIYLVFAISLLALVARSSLAEEPATGHRVTARVLTLSVDSFRQEALLSRFDADKN